MKPNKDFFKKLPELHEAALILAETDSEILLLEAQLASAGFKSAHSWSDIAEILQSGSSVHLTLSSMVSEEVLDVLSQFQNRGGVLQIMERATLNLISYNYDCRSVSLVITCLRENWLMHQQQAQILKHLGPIVSAEDLICH